MRGRSERIIGFELDHRPDDNAHRRKRLLERMELREQRALDAGTGLVVRPKPIAKRLDHVVGGDAEVRVAVLDHLEHRLQHADDGAVGAVHALVEPAQAVKVTEEFVSAVDEVNDHFGNAGKGDRACNSRWRSLYEGLMRMSMNTTLSGSGRVDDIQSHPQGEFRGQTKLIKITEDVRKFAAEQKISE